MSKLHKSGLAICFISVAVMILITQLGLGPELIKRLELILITLFDSGMLVGFIGLEREKIFCNS